MPVFSHNTLILKEKQLLVLDEKKGLSVKVPSGGAAGIRTLPQNPYYNNSLSRLKKSTHRITHYFFYRFIAAMLCHKYKQNCERPLFIVG